MAHRKLDVQAQEWLCMARGLNASIARDNQELREHVVEAKRVLGRASSLPAGCGGMAAKVLREERVVLARRIAESPARARQIYRPLSMPSFIAEMKVATKRCGGAEDKKFSREPLFQDRLLSGRTSVKDAAVSADALNHRKGYENKQGGSSIAYDDEVCEVRTSVQEVPVSEDLQPVLSHSLHELISDLCQPIKVDDTLHHGQDHPLSVETSEVCISNRHSRSGSVAELAVNACMFVVAHGVQNCIANGCDLANGGTCVYDMIDDTMQLTDITDCMEEKRAVAEAYAALARSSDRAAGLNEALPKAAGAGSPLAQSEKEQSVLIAEVKALEDDTAVASLKQNLLAAADVAIATLAEEASEEPKQAEEMEAAKTAEEAAKKAEEERLAEEAAEDKAEKAEESRNANSQMEVEFCNIAGETSPSFSARLQKGLEGLGLTVRLYPDVRTGVLAVVDVHPQGSVAKYNSQQRASGCSMLIRPRMLITEVNGIQGNTEAMLEALSRSFSLQLRLCAAHVSELAEQKHTSPKEIVSMMNAIRAVRVLRSSSCTQTLESKDTYQRQSFGRASPCTHMTRSLTIAERLVGFTCRSTSFVHTVSVRQSSQVPKKDYSCG
ncbi:FAZ1 [Symbiodinium microadriaticum]|nr:FAZ1 [Symbiodinium microadriaticum]